MTGKYTLLLILSLLISSLLFSQESHHEDSHGEKEEFKIGDMIMHHVLDSHDWHITDIPKGNGEYTPVALHLPWIFYSSRDGVVFSSTHGLEEKGYVAHHDKLYALKEGAHVDHTHSEGHSEVHLDDHWIEENTDHAVSIWDFSLTKTSLQMIIIGILLVLTFGAVAKGYSRNDGQAPKGIQSFFEPIIMFIRDDVAKPFLGDNTYRFLPYLLTLFFFIWFSNLLGLTPFNSNIAGNISVTAALALLSMIMINWNGSKDYWKHIFLAPGLPKFLLPLMVIVEFIGVLTKPFALAIRLFANISAGHFMVLSMVGMLFIMGKGGESVVGATAISPISIGFTAGIFLLEMIVAVIQAFIFTLLTAAFLGMAMESHDHHEAHH
ncbi:MAG: F0F1 ATP synthase subunit A [Bacteroidota bacterium]